MTDKKKETPVDNSRRNFIRHSATALAGYIIVPRFVLGGKCSYKTKNFKV